MAPGPSCPRAALGATSRRSALTAPRSPRDALAAASDRADNPVAGRRGRCQGGAGEHRHRPAPALTDGVVTLRAHTSHDADAIVEQSLDPDSQRWTTVPRGYTREDALTWVERNLAAWGEPARGALVGHRVGRRDRSRPASPAPSTCDPARRRTSVSSASGCTPMRAARCLWLARRPARVPARLRRPAAGAAADPHPLAGGRRQLGLAAHGVGRAASPSTARSPRATPTPTAAPTALDTWTGSIAAGDPLRRQHAVVSPPR